MRVYKKIIKPFFDVVFAFLLLLLLSPLCILIILFYLLNGISNFLFLQKRIGLHEREFIMFKFKTYKTDPSDKKPLEDRKYWFTEFFRKISIDELPQLINIIKGEMSFIGPRPLLPEYLSLYNEKQKKRHQVKPGITGLAQVNSHKIKDWQTRLKLDVEYVNNISFAFDIKILIKTVHLIFSSRNIADLNKPFTGNE